MSVRDDEDNWDDLLTVLGNVLSRVSQDDKTQLVKAVDNFADVARREQELDILDTIYNAVK